VFSVVSLSFFVPPPAPPSFDTVRAAYCPSDARLLDRHGRVIHEQRVDPTRRRLPWTALSAVSPALIDAVLISEDRRFFDHGGVDWWAAAAALAQRLHGGTRRGASTITMQVAALIDPALQRTGGPRSPGEKWRQMRAAWVLERTWSKSRFSRRT
jgi:penicillin-binding protein 1C